ncbi:MAG: 16S rRNA (cytosine(1402)-N(4))-methyltransferase RsmH [Syntrophobacteraceae bacterium]
MQGKHIPVMCNTAVGLLACRPGGLYVDGTLGGGGYAEEILKLSAPDGMLLGIDLDARAISRGHDRLHEYEERLLLEEANFADILLVLRKVGWQSVDGIVIDLGVSSFQLDDPDRGFSFTQDGPLDMRMDSKLPISAADLVNSLPQDELANLIFRFGEERWSRRIARAIVTERNTKQIERTRELAELIRRTVPKSEDSRRIHPATRTFQALRIAVNKELESLERFLENVLDVLKPGGRLSVVAFHSLEDRIVKERFRNWAKSCRCPKTILICECEGRPLVRLLNRKALKPEPDEIARNPRARSARLRAIEKLPVADRYEY